MTGRYLFKVNKRNARSMCSMLHWMCAKLKKSHYSIDIDLVSLLLTRNTCCTRFDTTMLTLDRYFLGGQVVQFSPDLSKQQRNQSVDMFLLGFPCIELPK